MAVAKPDQAITRSPNGSMVAGSLQVGRRMLDSLPRWGRVGVGVRESAASRREDPHPNLPPAGEGAMRSATSLAVPAARRTLTRWWLPVLPVNRA